MLIAGNWKMNTDADGAAALATEVAQAVSSFGDVRVAVCPPLVSLSVVHVALAVSNTHVTLGAQNMYFEDTGAYTGEVSATMLKSVGCSYVIIGHSERRQYFGETDKSVNRKTLKAMEYGLTPIVCVGETLEERDAGHEREVVRRQVVEALKGISLTDADQLVIAYEPVWAIGTGRTATPEQAQEIHQFIRTLLNDQFGGDMGSSIHILYGGSMKPGNAPELLGQPDVDGGLIGGASLKAEDFAGIVKAGAASL